MSHIFIPVRKRAAHPRARPIRPLSPSRIPTMQGDKKFADGVYRAPAGGGYRILRRPRMLDSED